MPDAPLILAVDDETDLLHALLYHLEREGFRTRSAEDGATALAKATRAPYPDLILLDWMLPDIPGTDVFRELRTMPETRSIPVMLVTARDSEIDRIVGLELGANDYVVKPYFMRELVLRVRSILRMTKQSRPQPLHAPARPLNDPEAFGPLKVDPGAHQVWIDDEEVHLTALEYRLLLALFERRGRVLSRDALLASAWRDKVKVTERTVDTHMKRLRRKLGPAADYIRTVRGVGYRFSASPEVN